MTQTDAQRDQLRQDRTTTEVVIESLRDVGVRADLVERAGVDVQSEETVSRD